MMKKFIFSLSLGLIFFCQLVSAQANLNGKIKLYSQMGFDEKLRFVSTKSDEILAFFGRTEGDEINRDGLMRIKFFLDNYTKRFASPKLDSCRASDVFKNDLTSVLNRGSQNASMIREEFSALKLPPQIGIYLAMIESEFCPCIQSSTGSLGMFQFGRAAGKEYGLNTISGATSANPDERCQPKLAARAASKYTGKLIDEIFGKDAVGIPLAIGAYNRGESSTKKHISDVAFLTKSPRISFWVLMDTSTQLREKYEKEEEGNEDSHKVENFTSMFEQENVDYVTKFFAAAIIGENPKIFGVNIMPLSQIK